MTPIGNAHSGLVCVLGFVAYQEFADALIYINPKSWFVRGR